MVNQRPHISIVMPCYNEQDAIPVLIPRTLESLEELKKEKRIQDFELIVVNDQSTDSSMERLKSFSAVKVVSTQGSRGYGNALKTGFKIAKGDWIGFLDVDNTYRPEDLKSFIDQVEKNDTDFIMGARGLDEKGMSFTRGLGNWVYVVLARVFYGSPLSDVCSGYRLFHRKYLAEIVEIPEQGLDFSIYLTLNMLLQQVTIRQIPIQYDARIGESKLSIYSDGWAFLKVLLTLKLRRLRVFNHRRVW